MCATIGLCVCVVVLLLEENEKGRQVRKENEGVISKTKNELYTREKVRSEEEETINKKERGRFPLLSGVSVGENGNEFSGEKEEKEGL